MVTFDSSELALWSSGHWRLVPPNMPIAGFSIDTRTIGTGQLFVAIRSANRDGHDFLDYAKKSGAAAALVDHEISGCELPQLVVDDTVKGLMAIASGHRNKFDGKVIGVTGSCGKTSTKDALALLLGGKSTCKTQGNLNNRLGLSLTLLSIDRAEHGSAVVEAGISENGEMLDLATTLSPDAAIVTLVGEAHMEGLGTLQDVAKEKYRLVEAVRPGGFALFPAECLEFNQFKEGHIDHWVLTECGKKLQSEDCLIYRHVPAEGSETGSLELSSDYFEDHTFDLPLAAFGQANVKNLSMALGVGLRSGVSFELLQKRLYDWKPSPLRGEVRVSGQQVYYADCYNANPVSMQEAISTFSNRFDKLPKLYVLGSMNELGDVSEDLHKSTGAKLQLQKGDRAVLCGPESEAILEGMVDSGSDIEAITLVERAEDARMLVDSFKGAILLKGSRTYGLECLMPKVETYEERRLAAC